MVAAAAVIYMRMRMCGRVCAIIVVATVLVYMPGADPGLTVGGCLRLHRAHF